STPRSLRRLCSGKAGERVGVVTAMGVVAGSQFVPGRSRVVSVEPPELGRTAGLAWARFAPQTTPRGALLILHGAGSAKESHYDFARLARSAGWCALCFDARGHGES